MQAGEKLKELIGPVDEEQIILISSDFKRTRETAEIIHSTLGLKSPLQFNIGLRERNLGDLDLRMFVEALSIYDEDENDITCARLNAECIASIAERVSSVVKSVNQEYKGKVVILVSHQDTLHTLHSLFINWPLAACHKHSPPIGNCNILELKTE